MTATYDAICWAESKTTEEIETEIERVDQPRDFTNHKAGSAHYFYLYAQALKRIVSE